EEDLHRILHRHHCGDWGDLGEGDKRANEAALEGDERILSRYDLECGSFYIITEANRSVTTVMGVEGLRANPFFSAPPPRLTPHPGGLEFEEALIDVDGLDVIARAGAFPAFSARRDASAREPGVSSGDSTMTSSPSTVTVMRDSEGR